MHFLALILDFEGWFSVTHVVFGHPLVPSKALGTDILPEWFTIPTDIAIVACTYAVAGMVRNIVVDTVQTEYVPVSLATVNTLRGIAEALPHNVVPGQIG